MLMEFNFVIKHIKGSSNMTADNLSRLPLCVDGGAAEYPDPGGQLQRLQQLPAVLCTDVAVIVQMLAQQPQREVYDVTICQVVGESRSEAWDILPLCIADVSRVTRLDPVYGKLLNAVRSGG